MVGVIAKKIGMTRVYHGDRLIPCTIVHAKPCVVTQIKDKATDGYEAVQLGYDEKKPKNTTKPLQKHFDKANTTPKKKLVEFRNFAQDIQMPVTLGASMSASELFEEGEYIDVVGTSKGKGFSGVVKRHGFGGVGSRTHGQHNRERHPGSIGAGSDPGRIPKGRRMAGRQGGDRVTVKNLQVVKIIPQENLIVLAGPVPGAKNNYIILKK